MKTTMQEFIDYLQEMQDDDFDSKTQYIIENAIKAKEKEKEQIINAYAEGRISVITKEIISYQEYYNSNFGDKVEEAGI